MRNLTAYESIGQYSARVQSTEATTVKAVDEALAHEHDFGEQYDDDGSWRYCVA